MKIFTDAVEPKEVMKQMMLQMDKQIDKALIKARAVRFGYVAFVLAQIYFGLTSKSFNLPMTLIIIGMIVSSGISFIYDSRVRKIQQVQQALLDGRAIIKQGGQL